MPSPLISAADAVALGDRAVFLDATYFSKGSGFIVGQDETGAKGAQHSFQREAVAGAFFFNMDDVAAAKGCNPCPMMLPARELFHAVTDAKLPEAVKLSALAEEAEAKKRPVLVVYDIFGAFSACRGYFVFRHFGAAAGRVRVVNGGLAALREAGAPVGPGDVERIIGGDVVTQAIAAVGEDVAANAEAKTNNAAHLSKPDGQRFLVFNRAETAKVADKAVAGGSAVDEFAIADARNATRFADGAFEGSRNMPFANLLEADSVLESTGKPSRFQDAKGMARVFVEHGVNPLAPLLTSCGMGLTACIVNVAAEHVASELGGASPHQAVYDASWSEWSTCGPVAKQYAGVEPSKNQAAALAEASAKMGL